MSRKLVAGFRTLLDDVCVAWSDAGASVYANEWGGDADSNRAQQKAEREAHRAKRKLERELLQVLIAAHYVTLPARQGFAVPSAITMLANALDALEREARMQGRRFTRGHSERYAQRRGA